MGEVAAQAFFANVTPSVPHGIAGTHHDQIVNRPENRQLCIIFLDGIQNGQGNLLVHQIQNHQIRLFCVQQPDHIPVGFLGIIHVQHHIQFAFDAAMDRSIGHKILLLVTGKILFLILHGEENDLMPSGTQSLRQRKIIGLASAFSVMKFIDQQYFHNLPH